MTSATCEQHYPPAFHRCFESHEEYNKLLKNSADAQFSFLQKFQETTPITCATIQCDGTPTMDGAPTLAGRRPPARQFKTVHPPTTMCPPLPAGLCPPPPASTCAHMRPPSSTGRRLPARQYKTVLPPTTMRQSTTTLACRLARGCAQEREGGGCQLVCGSRPGSTPGIHYILVHRLT